MNDLVQLIEYYFSKVEQSKKKKKKKKKKCLWVILQSVFPKDFFLMFSFFPF